MNLAFSLVFAFRSAFLPVFDLRSLRRSRRVEMTLPAGFASGSRCIFSRRKSRAEFQIFLMKFTLETSMSGLLANSAGVVW
jgi:hypothetical protein